MPPLGVSVSPRVVPALLQFQVLALVVVAHSVCSFVQLFLCPAELDHAPFDVLLGLDELLGFFKGEGVLEVIIGGVFLHDVLGYGGVLQSLHQGVQDHLVCVGGLAHW